jgi:hypothetical protein
MKRCCENCVYAKRPQSHWLRVILSHWRTLWICCNSVRCPGEMTEVFAGGTCRNFRQRRGPRGKRGEPPRPPNDKIRYIPLTQGQIAVVDAEDFEKLSRYKWFAIRGHHTFYVATRDKTTHRIILMHRVIMQAPDGMVVDHVDGNGLNNCRSNLRICTQKQNTYNSRPKGGKSGFKGVDYDKGTGKCRAYICHQGKRIPLGVFDSEIEAARARDRKARELQGEHAWLNLPEEVQDAGDQTPIRRPRPQHMKRPRLRPRYLHLRGMVAAHSSAVATASLCPGAAKTISPKADKTRRPNRPPETG